MLFCPLTFFYFFPQTEKFSPGIKSGKSGITGAKSGGALDR